MTMTLSKRYIAGLNDVQDIRLSCRKSGATLSIKPNSIKPGSWQSNTWPITCANYGTSWFQNAEQQELTKLVHGMRSLADRTTVPEIHFEFLEPE